LWLSTGHLLLLGGLIKSENKTADGINRLCVIESCSVVGVAVAFLVQEIPVGHSNADRLVGFG
jgi:hypothetical protein